MKCMYCEGPARPILYHEDGNPGFVHHVFKCTNCGAEWHSEIHRELYTHGHIFLDEKWRRTFLRER